MHCALPPPHLLGLCLPHCAQAVGRWANALINRAFRMWQASTQDAAARRARLVGVVARMARRMEVLVLQAWHRYVAERRNTLAHAIVDRLLVGRLRDAFAIWCAYVASVQRARELDAEQTRTSASLPAEVTALRRELALTRRELAHVSASTAWRYELAVVRNELKQAIGVIASHTVPGIYVPDALDPAHGGVQTPIATTTGDAGIASDSQRRKEGQGKYDPERRSPIGAVVAHTVASTPREAGPSAEVAYGDGQGCEISYDVATFDATYRLPDAHFKYSTPTGLQTEGGPGHIRTAHSTAPSSASLRIRVQTNACLCRHCTPCPCAFLFACMHWLPALPLYVCIFVHLHALDPRRALA